MPAPDVIYIVLNGKFIRPPDLPVHPGASSVVVAVDGGAAHCLKLGWPVDVLIGDLDSLPKATLRRVMRANPGMELQVHDPDKDETDFELALGLVAGKYRGSGRIEVLGALGGRWDMTLSNLILPLSDRFLSPMRKARLLRGQASSPPLASFRDGPWSLFLLSGPAWLPINPGQGSRRVSLVPLSPRVSRIRLDGCFRYPLDDEDLVLGQTRGVSNELGPGGGNVFLAAGHLLVSVSPLDEDGPAPKKGPSPVLAWKTPRPGK
ncbi:MAG: thiamine diphosphokinase [Deltaproteobacteria bacterium]|jgi:thiamine pyrophosphokinase|nr:thiamine diphosphokinase [Deltaproteobacteria bacterium]